MDLKLGYQLSLFKKMARTQLLLDKQFASEYFSLRRKVHMSQISPTKFWEQYKKSLLKSIAKNKKILADILKKIDSHMKKKFKEAEQAKEEKPLIDLRLPE